jgi:hypothetical protein
MSVPPLGDSLTTVDRFITQITCRHNPELYEFCNAQLSGSAAGNFHELYPRGREEADYNMRPFIFAFGLREEFAFMGAKLNEIGQAIPVSSSLNDLIVPKNNGIVDFDLIMAIPDQLRRNKAWVRGVKQIIYPWGLPRAQHDKITEAAIIANGSVYASVNPPVLRTSGIVDVYCNGDQDIHVGAFVRVRPMLPHEKEAHNSKFGTNESRRCLIVEPFNSNENVGVPTLRETLNMEDRRKPDFTGKPEQSVDIEITEDLVINPIIEYTRKTVLHAMAMATCLQRNPNFKPLPGSADLQMFKDEMDKWYKKLYATNSTESLMVPGYGNVTPSRYVELLAGDMLMDKSVTDKKFPPTTHNLLGAMHQNFLADLEWVVGRAVTMGTPRHMFTIQLGMQRP